MEIGGYFNFELRKNGSFPHDNGILLNSGRNALEVIFLSIGYITKLYVPYFTCDSILQPIKRQKIPFEFYHINDNLEIKDLLQPKEHEYILYTNYFGLKDEYLISLLDMYPDHIIIDNAQAFFSPLFENIPTAYSPRKFLGIPDGGIAFLGNGLNELYNSFPKDKSYQRCSHLLKRFDLGASAAYQDFRKADESLNGADIMSMSNLTKSILCSIDYDVIQEKRRINFNILHHALKKSNLLNINTNCTAMVYPYYAKNGKQIKKKLITKGIFVATYWQNVKDWCKVEDLEYVLTENLVALPIDQRYGEKEMNMIIDSL